MAFWTAGLISPLGDRLTTLALAVMMLERTGSPFLVGAVAVAGVLPALLVGPLAGALADRLPRRQSLVASDLFRAGLVVLLPISMTIHPAVAIPLVFLVSSAGLVFRSAKVVAVADLVSADDLDAANGATIAADSMADVIGYPLAGVLVIALGSNLPVLFALDAITYVVSAALLVSLRLGKPATRTERSSILQELRAGWRFLRGDRPLLENTVLSMVAQVSIGLNLALLVVFASERLHDVWLPYPGNFAALQTALGIGAVVGGLVAGGLGGRKPGRTILSGFAAMGALQIAASLSSTATLALPLVAAVAVANLVWLVPTQTLFITRTRRDMLGRVVAIRGALTFGTMAVAMLVGSAAAGVLSVHIVLGIGGAITLAAAGAGTLRPALLAPEHFA